MNLQMIINTSIISLAFCSFISTIANLAAAAMQGGGRGQGGRAAPPGGVRGEWVEAGGWGRDFSILWLKGDRIKMSYWVQLLKLTMIILPAVYGGEDSCKLLACLCKFGQSSPAF